MTAPPLKERALELVKDFQGAIQWTEQQPPTHEARDGYSWYACARSDLLTFIDQQVDALSAANARVAELERVSEGACAAIEGEFSHYSHAVQLHCALLRTALQPPTEEPGK